MAEFRVNVSMAVPDETVRRCFRLLEMWLDDNPDKTIIADRVAYTDGFRHELRIHAWQQKEEENNV